MPRRRNRPILVMIELSFILYPGIYIFFFSLILSKHLRKYSIIAVLSWKSICSFLIWLNLADWEIGAMKSSNTIVLFDLYLRVHHDVGLKTIILFMAFFRKADFSLFGSKIEGLRFITKSLFCMLRMKIGDLFIVVRSRSFGEMRILKDWVFFGAFDWFYHKEIFVISLSYFETTGFV